MARKIILDVDPGIDDAVALCLALGDPSLDVLAVTATGGTVSPDQATINVQAIVEQLDPPRWPRLGTASTRPDAAGRRPAPVRRERPVRRPFRRRPAASSAFVGEGDLRRGSRGTGRGDDRRHGPLSNIAAALQQQPDLASLIGHLIILGGTLAGPGNVTAAAEFNIYCDAEAARAVFHSPVTKTLIPIDLTSRVMLNFDLLEKIPDGDSRRGELLRQILPGAFRAYRQQLGVEGIHLHDTVAIVAAMQPELFTTERMYGDVETDGTLTYGATVFDRRRHAGEPAEHGRGRRHGYGGRDRLHPGGADASGVTLQSGLWMPDAERPMTSRLLGSQSAGYDRLLLRRRSLTSPISIVLRIGLPSRKIDSSHLLPISVSFTRPQMVHRPRSDAVEFEDHVVDLQVGLLGGRLGLDAGDPRARPAGAGPGLAARCSLKLMSSLTPRIAARDSAACRPGPGRCGRRC